MEVRLSLESRKNTTLDDPGADLLDQMQGFWDRSGRIVLGVVAALVIAGLGWYYVNANNERRENAASEKLAEASDLFWRGDYDRSRSLAKDVAKSYPGTPSGIDSYRISGDAAYWRDNWKDAIADYEAYLKARGNGLLADGIRRSLAYALESDGRLADAAAMYEKVVGVFDRETSGEMLYAAGRCLLAAGKPDEAKKRFQRVVDEFPDSSFQLQARMELGKLAPITVN